MSHPHIPMISLQTHRVEIRKGLGDGDWRDFSTVIFEISLDNKNFHGDHFRSILSWARTKFTHAHVIICDSLQRHNIKYDFTCSEPTAEKRAQLLGKKWIRENKRDLDASALTYEISTWKNWKNPSLGYLKELNALKRTYNTDINFRTEFDTYLNQLWLQKAKSKDLTIDKKDMFIERVLRPYFFEETVVTAIFLSHIEGISAYPGSLPRFWESLIYQKYAILQGFANHTFLRLDLARRQKRVA